VVTFVKPIFVMQDFSSPTDPVPPPVPTSLTRPPIEGRSTEATSLTEASGNVAPAPAGTPASLTVLRWITFLIALLLLMQYAIPYFIERYQYAVTRGRQRAEYEVAAEGLKNLPLDELSKAYQMVSQHVGPSVVHISVRSVHEQQVPNEFAQLYGPQLHVLQGQGSGVIVDPRGYIVTNYHVVFSAAEILVSLSDGRVLPGQVVGTDVLTDLAVLKVEGGELVAAEWGDSDSLDVGALVWAVGSPFGLQRTITSGIVSAKHRSGMAGEVYQDFLQTDAAVNPGNSGGPLVDARGRVVGINTAILGERYQGVSFAIPSSVAQQVYERLKTDGQVARGWLGLDLREVSDEDVRSLGLPDKQGAFVDRVLTNIMGIAIPSPAKDAGIQPGDVVVRWNDSRIRKPSELIRLVGMTEIGSSATVVLLRGGREVSLTIKIAGRPEFLDS